MTRLRVTVLLLLAALAVLLLLSTGREGSPTSPSVERGEDGVEELPLLRGRGGGEAEEDEESLDEVVDTGFPGWTRLHGTVRLEDTREPVEGGRVLVLFVRAGAWSGTANEFRALPEEERSQMTEKTYGRVNWSGEFSVRLLRGGIVLGIHVERPAPPDAALANFVERGQELWLLLDREEILLDLTVPPGLVIRGEARDAVTGDPVDGVRVRRATLFGPRAGGHGEEDGTFRVTGLREGDTYAPGGLVFQVTHPDYLPQRFRARYDRERRAFPYVEVEMTRGVRIGGRLTMDGEPHRTAADVLLVVRGPGTVPWAAPERELCRTRSDGEGRFHFLAIPPTANADVVVPPADGLYTGGGAGARLEGLDLTHDRDDLRVDLVSVTQVPVRPVTPEGEVVDASGSRVYYEDVRGVLRPAGYRGGSDPVLWLVGLAPGHEHRIVVYAEGKDERGLIRLSRGETVAAGGGTREVPVRLEPWSFPGIPYEGPLRVQTCTLGSAWYAQHVWQMRVTDASTGRPVARRTFEVETDTGGRVSTALYDEGLVRLSLPPGPARLSFHVEGYEPVVLTLVPRGPGYEEVDLALTPLEVR